MFAHSQVVCQLVRKAFSALRVLYTRNNRRSVAFLYEFDSNSGSTYATSCGILPEGYSFRLATIDDLAACAATGGYSPDECYRRIKNGDSCFITIYNNRPATLSWVSFGSVYIRGIGYLLDNGPDTAYLYNIFTDPAHRGKGLYRTILTLLHQQIAQRGVARFRQIVMDGNVVPISILPQLGYRITQQITHIRVFSIGCTVARDNSGRIVTRKVFPFAPQNCFRI